jgi:hypothetical protein
MPGLLGSAYAYSQCVDPGMAAVRFHEYLSRNPWDFETQLAYTNCLCKLGKIGEALKHAHCASLLRPSDASAYILILNSQIFADKEWNIGTTLDKMRADASGDPDLEWILANSQNGAKPFLLKRLERFEQLAIKVKSRAEDPKNGYKMLGEP